MPNALQACRSLLHGRRTVALYEAVLPVHAGAALTRAVDAARYAPNHRKTEPWRFYALGPKAVGRVLELGDATLTAKHGADKAAKKMRRWRDVPGWMVVTCARTQPAGTTGKAEVRAREDYAACCCATHNVMLSLFAEGIGSKWSSFGTHAEEGTVGGVEMEAQFAEAVGFDGDAELAVATIWYGTPMKWPAPPKKLLDVEALLITTD